MIRVISLFALHLTESIEMSNTFLQVCRLQFEIPELYCVVILLQPHSGDGFSNHTKCYGEHQGTICYGLSLKINAFPDLFCFSTARDAINLKSDPNRS